MPRSERNGGETWRGWLALAWAVAFGLLYGSMILERRAPGALAAWRKAWPDSSHPAGEKSARAFPQGSRR